MGALIVRVGRSLLMEILEEAFTQCAVAAGVTLGEEGVKYYFRHLDKKPKAKRRVTKKRRKRS